MSNTIFSQVNYTLGHLAGQIEQGTIGLPDIQRPFVWKNSKVRDLFDSMYRGYPVGSRLPVFTKDGEVERFYIRTGPATAELTGNQSVAYIKERFA